MDPTLPTVRGQLLMRFVDTWTDILPAGVTFGLAEPRLECHSRTCIDATSLSRSTAA